MAETGTHYIHYDPEEIWKLIRLTHISEGGDILYPGDEKEILLRGVQAMVTQVLAMVDTALRMDTLRYAEGEFLDLYGEKRNCIRLKEKNASSRVEIRFTESGQAKTIPAGTAMTADGERMYLLNEDVAQTGYDQTVIAGIISQDAGSAGNGLTSGTQMQFVLPNPAVESIYTIMDASGGEDREDDETYRERIRAYGLINTTTGPSSHYESAAMKVSSEILDARALNLGAGVVGVYLIVSSDTGAAAIIESVKEKLNAQDVRPLTDSVEVYEASKIPYVLNVTYAQESGQDIASSVAKAVEEYRSWQDEEIGRAFNPDKLMAMLYQAGATRVLWGEGSHFNGGDVEYTTISENAHCKGEITPVVMT